MADVGLSVPVSRLSRLRSLASAGEDILRASAEVLEQVEPSVHRHDVVSAVAGASGADPRWAHEVLVLVWSLATARSLLGLSSDELAERLTVVLEGLDEEEWSKADRENWRAKLPDIRRLLDRGTAFSSDPRAAELFMEQPSLEPGSPRPPTPIPRRALERAPGESHARAPQIAGRFAALSSQWKRETAHLSSVSEMVLHPAYQQIIGMGPAVLPLIVRDLRRELGHWFWALRAITGENPVSEDDAGNMRRMRDAWLRLADEEGWAA